MAALNRPCRDVKEESEPGYFEETPSRLRVFNARRSFDGIRVAQGTYRLHT